MTPGTIYRKSDGREREFLRAYRDVRTCTDLVVARFTEPGRAPEVRTVTAQGWALIIAGCEVIPPACVDPGGGAVIPFLDRTSAGIRIVRWSGPVAPVSSPHATSPAVLDAVETRGSTGTPSPARGASIGSLAGGAHPAVVTDPPGCESSRAVGPGGGSTSMREAEPTWASDTSSLPSSGRRGDLPVDGESGVAASVEGA